MSKDNTHTHTLDRMTFCMLQVLEQLLDGDKESTITLTRADGTEIDVSLHDTLDTCLDYMNARVAAQTPLEDE